MPARTEEHWWGWIVVCASFLVQAISLGTCSAVSGLTVQWLQHFQKSKEITAWIASLNLATTFCSGVFASALSYKIGHKLTSMIGCVLAASGMVMSAFSTNVYHLYFTYGIVTGCGFSLMYMSSLAVVAMYFKQNIGIATGLSLLGTGCGIIVTPVVIQWLVNLFSWRGAMIVWAAVFVQCTPLCTLYTPLYQISSSSYNGPIHLNHLYTSHFVCFLLSSFFFSAGAGIVWILLGDYVKQVGLTENNGSQLITCIGGGEVIGTVGWCALTQTRFSIKQASKMRIYNAGVGLRCLTIAMYPLFTNFSALVTISIVHGVGYGVQNAVFVASLIEFIRNNDVAFALGFYGITYGMGGLLGPPVGGRLFDITGVYKWSFVTAAGLVLVSIVVLEVGIQIKRRSEAGNSICSNHDAISTKTQDI